MVGLYVDKSNYNGPCPCYPSNIDIQEKSNYGRVYYKRGNATCVGSSTGWGEVRTIKVKIPFFPPTLPNIAEVYTCTDGSAEITVDVPSDVFYQERPTKVFWYKVDMSNPALPIKTLIYTSTDNYFNLKSTLKYTFPINFIGYVEVNSSRNYDGCPLKSQPIQIPVIAGAGLPLIAPTVVFEKSCDGGSKALKIDNPYSYDGVLWYEGILSNTPIYDGFVYNVNLRPGLNEFYVEYYKIVGANDCRIKSPKSVFYVYVAPTLTAGPIEDRNIYDWRHFDDADCFVNRTGTDGQQYPYYTDLEDPTTVNIFMDRITNQLNPTNAPCLKLNNLEIRQDWVVGSESHAGLSPYTATKNTALLDVYRICAENLSPDETQLGSKRYDLKVSAKFQMQYCDNAGVLRNGGSLECDMKGAIKRVSVYTIKPGPVSDLGCVFPPQALVQRFLQGSSIDCNRQEQITICNDQTLQIGPKEEELRTYFFGPNGAPLGFGTTSKFKFKWLETRGLSDPNIANPMLTANLMSLDDYNLRNYSLEVTIEGALAPVYAGKAYNYCALVYKCGICKKVNPTSIDNIIGN